MFDGNLFQNIGDASVNRNVIRTTRKENVIVVATSLGPCNNIRISVEGNIERHPFVRTEPGTLDTFIRRSDIRKLFVMLKYSIRVLKVLLVGTARRECRRCTNGNMRRNLVFLCAGSTPLVLFRIPTTGLGDRTF